jgi:hypothetical protein
VKKAILVVLFVTVFGQSARADMFGGDIIVLSQILSNAVAQLAQLRSILQGGQDTLNLLHDINQGINDSLNVIRTVSPNSDPGIYKDWDKVSSALNKLQTIYGIAVESNDSHVQQDTDQSVAEAVTMNNDIYKYTQQIDEIGEQIKAQSHSVSPGGASKLTAQSLGIMLTLQNEMLRTQATGLKLQAQSLAVQNRKDKERTRQMVSFTDDLSSSLERTKADFTLPKFE